MLTDIAVRNANSKEKPYKLSDSGGLYLLVKSAGKYWRMDYRFAGKRKTIALGVYPTVTLVGAREGREKARKLLADNTDPVIVKAINKQTKQHAGENTFEAVALEWFAKKQTVLASSTAVKIKGFLDNNIFPWLGGRQIKEITAPELVAIENWTVQGLYTFFHQLNILYNRLYVLDDQIRSGHNRKLKSILYGSLSRVEPEAQLILDSIEIHSPADINLTGSGEIIDELGETWKDLRYRNKIEGYVTIKC
tara:strand:- start:364 stop:1113 length:750 start_codon:yes stop_codon:yes gene_type:complete